PRTGQRLLRGRPHAGNRRRGRRRPAVECDPRGPRRGGGGTVMADDAARDDTPPKLTLSQISTNWREIHDPLWFMLTYGPAVRAYLLAILRDDHEADDALQDLLLQVTQQGLRTANPERGRFRDYLKAVVRNAALKRLRQNASRPGPLADAA